MTFSIAIFATPNTPHLTLSFIGRPPAIEDITSTTAGAAGSEWNAVDSDRPDYPDLKL
jgi:hypothetical protein